jgi:hypothetical protein
MCGAALVLVACGSGAESSDTDGSTTGSTGPATGDTGTPTTGSTTATTDDKGVVCPTCAGTCDLRAADGGNPAWALLCGSAVDEAQARVAATGSGSLTVVFELGHAADKQVSLALGQTFVEAGQGDAIVARLGAGGALEWSQAWSGPGFARPQAAAGSAAGRFAAFIGASDVTTIGAEVVTCPGECGVIAVLGPDGVLAWQRSYQGANYAFGLAIGPSGEVAVAGAYAGATDFGAGPVSSSGSEPFVTVHEVDGTLRFARTYLSAGGEAASIAFAADGSLVIGGTFSKSIALGDPALVADDNATFVARLAPTGETLWARQFDSPGAFDHQIKRVVIDSAGNIGIAGTFIGRLNLGGVDLDNADPAQVEDPNYDVFVAGLDPAGTHLWSARLGDEENDDRIAGLDVAEPLGLQVAWAGETSGSRLDRFDGAGVSLASVVVDVPGLHSAARDVDGTMMLAGSHAGPFDLLGPWTPAGEQDLWVTRILP